MKKRIFKILFLALVFVFIFSTALYAEDSSTMSDLGNRILRDSGITNESVPLELFTLLSTLSFLPAIILMMTAFTRIIIILSFVRNAMGTQQAPPNLVIIGLSLFLTFFVMQPVFSEVNTKAVEPYLKGDITQDEAVKLGEQPLRDFMIRQTRPKDLNLFLSLAGISEVEDYDEIPFHVIVPSFIISELKSAFQVGFILYIPFLVIDMVVSSTLMAMGMMMLPPVIISLPFKILLFVMVDGWNLLVGSIIQSFK